MMDNNNYYIIVYIFSLLAYFRPSGDQHPWSSTVSSICHVGGYILDMLNLYGFLKSPILTGIVLEIII